jgi:hypothetical protein
MSHEQDFDKKVISEIELLSEIENDPTLIYQINEETMIKLFTSKLVLIKTFRNQFHLLGHFPRLLENMNMDTFIELFELCPRIIDANETLIKLIEYKPSFFEDERLICLLNFNRKINEETFIKLIKLRPTLILQLNKKFLIEIRQKYPKLISFLEPSEETFIGAIENIRLFSDMNAEQIIQFSHFPNAIELFRVNIKSVYEKFFDKFDSHLFQNIGVDLKNVKEFILELSKKINDSANFSNQIESLIKYKSNVQLGLEILKFDWRYLEHLNCLQNEKKIILKVVRENGLALQFAEPKLTNDEDIVAAAVGNNGMSLQFVGNAIKEILVNDKQIMISIIQNNGLTLQFACSEVKSNKETVLIAVKNDGLSLKYANDSLKEDPTIIMEAIKQNIDSFKYCHLLENEEIFKYLFQNNYKFPSWISPKIKNNKEIMLIAVTQNGMVLEFLKDDFKKDRDIVRASIKQNRGARKFAIMEDSVLIAIEEEIEGEELVEMYQDWYDS